MQARTRHDPPPQRPPHRTTSVRRATRTLDEQRQAGLDPAGASEADLKQRTLTTLDNARPAWLAQAHAALDGAVWAAYGWEEAEPGETLDETILERLLALNGERAKGSSEGSRGG
jgi:hypothetical protein